MSKKFKPQASRSRAAFGSSVGAFGGFSATAPDRQNYLSSLSYVAEPPDLSKISTQSQVVTFKNLLKKDSTTKTKALEELQDFITNVESQNGALEDGFLEAWIRIYPRTSIDTSRRVRQLSHAVQGYVVSSSGKRIARYIPRVVGAWLAGLYDSDKLVLKAAQESIARGFPTEEKRQSVWRVYQSAILEFVEDAVLRQTPSTLSDERTARPDEAQAKHARVVATATQVFNQLLARAASQELEKDTMSIQTLLRSKSLWSLSYHDDSFVRRSTYSLLQTSLSIEGGFLDWKIISACLLSKSLSIRQFGSALQFSNLLLNLTRKRPLIWTEDYSGKTPARERLHQYIKEGSQGAPPSYWQNLPLLLQCLPVELLITQSAGEGATLHQAISLMEAIHGGILNRGEQKSNLGYAWSSFVYTAFWMSTLISENADRQRFLKGQVSPLLEQYVMDEPGQPEWTLPGQLALKLSTDCFVRLAELLEEDILRDLWVNLSNSLIQTMELSSPDASQDYRACQDSICSRAARLFTLESEVLKRVSTPGSMAFISSIFRETVVLLLQHSLQILRSRNGEPYGAAAVLDEAMAKMPELMTELKDIDAFLEHDIPNLLSSPSGARLISLLFVSRGRGGFELGLTKSIDLLCNQTSGSQTLPPLQKLLSSINSSDIQSHPALEILIMANLDQALEGARQLWTNITIIMENPASQHRIADQILRSIVDKLSTDHSVPEALYGLSQIISHNPISVRTLTNGQDGSRLISRLLYLAESPADEIASLADSLKRRIKELVDGNDSKSSVEIIQHNFSEVGSESLSVDALVEIGQEVLLKTPDEDRASMIVSLLPTEEHWEAALDPFLGIPPKESTAITNALGGVVYLVDRTLSKTLLEEPSLIPRDSSHFSLAFRIAFYITKLFSTADSMRYFESHSDEALLLYFPLAIHLIDDDLSIEGSNKILGFDPGEVRDEFVDLVSEARLLIKSLIQIGIENEQTGGTNFLAFWSNQFKSLQTKSPKAYRIAEVLVKLMSEQDSLGAASFVGPYLDLAKRTQGLSNPFLLPCVISAFRDAIRSTSSGIRLCNELVADITGLDPNNEAEALRKISTLNLLVHGENSIIEKIPIQRRVFLVKNLIQCLSSDLQSLGLISEILKLLALVFPLIREIYGSHWVAALEILKLQWDRSKYTDAFLPAFHSSLRLFACLRSLAASDSNDDLKDAWIEAEKTHVGSLARVLTEFGPSYNIDQPRNIAADLLARQLSDLSVCNFQDIDDLYPVLSAQTDGIQRAAYGVLHRVIPKLQEKVSFNAALSNKVASLPDELLSLLLEAPTIDIMSHLPVTGNVWLGVRCYLLSWKIVFDHFALASLRVQGCYSNNIKENDCLNPLLDFMFDFLQNPQGKFVDASKLAVDSFELDQSDSFEKEAQWLLVHLYYLCLKYLPNLIKSWWIDSKKRIKGPVEAWTQKYISTFIIEDSLRSVSEWFSAQDWTSEEQPLHVKVHFKAAELVASIEVDEESPPTSVSISLPPAYPLQPAVVTGGYRVAVDDNKWKSWLQTIQGVIMFSNGNLIDGLLAFRKNVQGALKGLSECAICYSVISAKMQTPNKTCATCKNTFHSDCLFRWFKSSNASSCPLCGNNFPYS